MIKVDISDVKCVPGFAPVFAFHSLNERRPLQRLITASWLQLAIC